METLIGMLASLLMMSMAMAGDERPPVVKQEIVVTAEREEQPHEEAAAAVTVLDRAAVERLPAESLAEVLACVPGVTMFFDNGTGGTPWITSRGFFGGGEVEYVKLMVDGMPVGDAESGNVDWRRFRAADIERIEVLRGPGSAMYGDTALGGVIQLFTRQPSDAVDVRLSGGGFGSREGEVRWDTRSGEPIAFQARLGGWSTDGFREHANAGDRTAAASFNHVSPQSTWRFDIAADREHRQEPGALTRAQIAKDREQSNPLFRFDDQTTSRASVAARYDSSGAIPLHALLYAIGRGDDSTRTVLLAPNFGASAYRSLTTRSGGGTFDASHETGGISWHAGTDLERASISGRYASVDPAGHRGSTVATEDGGRDRVGAFLTGAWSATARVRFTAGVRRDVIRDDFIRRATSSAWSPRAGVNVHLAQWSGVPVALFVQVANAFKAPTLDQLFDPRPYPNGAGGTFTISNAALRPQRAQNVEAGLSRTSAWSNWSVVAYRMKVRDEIDFDPQTFSYRNLGSSLHRGVEASLAVAQSARVWPQVTYAWTRVADTATPQLQLKNIPEHVAQLLLHARLSAKDGADIVLRRRGTVTLEDAGAFHVPAVSRIDLRLFRDVGRFRLQADVVNALDTRGSELGYVMYDFRGGATPYEYPAPGRQVRLAIAYTAGHDH